MKKVIWSFAFLFSACYFHPSGEFYKNIPPKDYTGLSINLTTASDTLYLDQTTQLSYNAITTSLPLVKISATLNDIEIYSTTSSSQGSFYILPNNYGTGTHQLKISLTVDSGTGSLIDKLGGEQVQVWRTFVVIIDVSPPATRTVSLDTTGGTITVHWNAYTKWNFHYYKVYKGWYADNEFKSVTRTFNSKDQTSWNDSSYVGGRVQYSVVVNENGSPSDVEYNWYPKFRFNIQNNVATIYWQKCVFYRNIEGQQFKLAGQPNSTLAITDSTYQTVVLPAFGHANDWSVTFISKNQANSFQLASTYYRGTRISSLMPEVYNPKYNLYYGYMSYSYAVMDSSLNYLGSMPNAPVSLSADGKYMIAYHQNDGPTGTFYQVDPVTMQLSNSHSANNIVGYFNVSNISNTGLIAMYTIFDTSVGANVRTWPDLQLIYTNSLVSINSSFIYAPLIISSSGQYLLESNKLYHNTGSSFQLVGAINNGSNIKKAVFTDTDNLILGYADGTIVILDTSLNVLNTIQNTVMGWDMNVLSYDPVSKRILVGGYYSGYYVINPQSGVLQFISATRVNLLNGKLFTGSNNYLYELNYDQF
jgi:hypothetical protein